MDVNRIGTKSDKIRFTSDSNPLHFSTKVCVYTERVDNFHGARAVRGLLREAIVLPSFRNLRKRLKAICFVQWQCSSIETFLACLRYFRKQYCFEGCLYFLRTLVYRSKRARKTFRKGFVVMPFPFTRLFSSKTSFFAGLSPSKFAYPLQKYPDIKVVYTERLGHFSYEISDLYNPDIFYPDSFIHSFIHLFRQDCRKAKVDAYQSTSLTWLNYLRKEKRREREEKGQKRKDKKDLKCACVILIGI